MQKREKKLWKCTNSYSKTIQKKKRINSRPTNCILSLLIFFVAFWPIFVNKSYNHHSIVVHVLTSWPLAAHMRGKVNVLQADSPNDSLNGLIHMCACVWLPQRFLHSFLLFYALVPTWLNVLHAAFAHSNSDPFFVMYRLGFACVGVCVCVPWFLIDYNFAIHPIAMWLQVILECHKKKFGSCHFFVVPFFRNTKCHCTGNTLCMPKNILPISLLTFLTLHLLVFGVCCVVVVVVAIFVYCRQPADRPSYTLFNNKNPFSSVENFAKIQNLHQCFVCSALRLSHCVSFSFLCDSHVLHTEHVNS